MALRTPVNSRITDAVTQSGVGVLAAAPAVAMGSIYQSAAHSISVVFENTVQAQKQASICAQAATNQGVIQIYSKGARTAAAAGARPVQADATTLVLAVLLADALVRKR